MEDEDILENDGDVSEEEPPPLPEEDPSVHGESILESIKKLLGIPDFDDSFDLDISIHINTAFMALNQLGVGPKKTYSIKDKTATWNDFFEDSIDFEGVKTYIYLKVRILFDPPTSSSVIDAFNQQCSEIEWRLHLNGEKKEAKNDDG